MSSENTPLVQINMNIEKSPVKLNDSIQTSKQKRKKTIKDYNFIVAPNGKPVLGWGSNSCVKLAVDKLTNEQFAIQIVII